MKVADFKNTIEVSNEAQLARVMARRYRDESNEFWLWHEPDEYPNLAITVKGDLAFLSYHPSEGVAGFISTGAVSSLDPDESTIFAISDGGETIGAANYQVVSFAEAYEAAREFLHSDALPSSIEWFEL